MEKRNHDRVRTDKFEVKYRFSSDDFETIASVLNISGGGICFLRTAPINKNDIIEILFPFQSKKVILRAQVVRIEGREVGLTFVDDQDKIAEFVDIFNREYKIIRHESILKEEKKKDLFGHRKKVNKGLDDDVDDILSDV